MEKRVTCAVSTGIDFDGKAKGEMCRHCSGADIDKNGVEFWKCKKYNVRLSENENNWLMRCDECITNGDM